MPDITPDELNIFLTDTTVSNGSGRLITFLNVEVKFRGSKPDIITLFGIEINEPGDFYPEISCISGNDQIFKGSCP